MTSPAYSATASPFSPPHAPGAVAPPQVPFRLLPPPRRSARLSKRPRSPSDPGEEMSQRLERMETLLKEMLGRLAELRGKVERLEEGLNRRASRDTPPPPSLNAPFPLPSPPPPFPRWSPTLALEPDQPPAPAPPSASPPPSSAPAASEPAREGPSLAELEAKLTPAQLAAVNQTCLVS